MRERERRRVDKNDGVKRDRKRERDEGQKIEVALNHGMALNKYGKQRLQETVYHQTLISRV